VSAAVDYVECGRWSILSLLFCINIITLPPPPLLYITHPHRTPRHKNFSISGYVEAMPRRKTVAAPGEGLRAVTEAEKEETATSVEAAAGRRSAGSYGGGGSSGMPLAGMSDDELWALVVARRVMRARGEGVEAVAAFGEHVFGLRPAAHHVEWMEERLRNKRVATVAPPESAKTRKGTTSGVVWEKM